MKMFNVLSRTHNIRPKRGDIGIEVEMEGRRLPAFDIPGWSNKPEGSLRGEAIEYVLSEPCREAEVKPLLDILWGTFAENKTVLMPSNRCSVHVHINVQRLTELQVFNYMVLYLIAEDALVRWCGEGRVGNLFCLRARDAEFLIDSLEETSVDGAWERLHTNDLRYSALNCKALGDFGSLEFRSLRGTDDPALIKTWVSILIRMREAACRYDFPNNILDGFSAGGEEAFCREVFGDHFEALFDYEGWREDVRSGMRRCQCIAYSGDWMAFANNEPVGDVKGVDKVRKHELRWVPLEEAPADPAGFVFAEDPQRAVLRRPEELAVLEAKRLVRREAERRLMERMALDIIKRRDEGGQAQ